MKIRNVFIVILVVFMTSCGSKKKATTSKKQSKTVSVSTKSNDKRSTSVNKQSPSKGRKKTYTQATEEYINTYKEYAMEEMRVYKIPASITLAQGILESGSGNSQLTQNSNNHFGIKCHDTWGGGTVYHDDDKKGECFRKYKDPAKSFRDHSLFLKNRRRYSKLFKLAVDDYVGWAKGLKKAGYATDRRYPAKLIGLIERFELYKYDNQVLGNTNQENNVVTHINTTETTSKPTLPVREIRFHTVAKGDTLYNISKRYNVTVEDIKNLNNLESNIISIGQTLRIILK